MPAAIDHNSYVPLHIQMEQYLRELIQEEKYQNGALLPTETEIAKTLGVSRNTFRAAMDRLVREGLVERHKGIGSRVRKKPIATTLSKWASFTTEMSSLGIELTTMEREAAWVEADLAVASALDVKPGEKVSRLERLMGVDGEPVVLFISYFHPRVGIRPDERFDGKLYDILEKRYNSIPAISNEEIGAMPCTPEHARRLRMPLGIPLLYRKRLVLNSAGKLLELCHAYYRSDRFVYNVQIMRGED